MEPSDRRIRKTLRRLASGARLELLDLLASAPEVRADAIRQLHEQPETQDLAEVLIRPRGRIYDRSLRQEVRYRGTSSRCGLSDTRQVGRAN